MKNVFVLLTLLFMRIFYSTVSAQTVDWSTQVAGIIYTNCASCHHTGSIAPFSLMSYDEAVENAFSIQNAVNAGKMPPWPADPDYRHFAYEAVLDQSEIDAINEWVNNEMSPGDLNTAPAPPIFAGNGSLLQSIDYTVKIEPYTLQYNTDEYRWFVIQTGFTDTVYVNKIEVIPGLDSIIHHADISYDLTGNSLEYDLADPLPGFNSNTGSPNYTYYMNAWQPGGGIAAYPENWGIMIPPGADFVLEIHYGPGAQGQVDSTIMNLQFVSNPQDVRPVSVQWILYDSPPCLQDGPLVIPANTIKTFHQKSSQMPEDRSFIAICPHQHHLGKSYRVWFETADGDSVPLIGIPQWNFYWQKYYTFQYPQKIPQGARIYSEATFDNTTNNPDNPHNPPITVSKGATTLDEMLLCYFIFTDYKDGDEDILLDSTLIATGAPQLIMPAETSWSVYPNPFSDAIHFQNAATSKSAIHFELRDVLGRLVVKKIYEPASSITFHSYSFAAGIYFYRLSMDGKLTAGKIIKE